MTIDFYYMPVSAPCRAVLLTAKAVGIEMNCKYLDLFVNEHLTPEFIKINPQHAIPTIVDDGFSIWESRAIQAYLVSEYAKDDSLYPKDNKKRSIVDQRMYFDMGTLYKSFAEYYYPVIFQGASTYDKSKMEQVEKAFEFLEIFLATTKYVAGDNLTIADLALVSTVSNFDIMSFDMSRYPKVTNWFKLMKETAPGYDECNGKNVILFKEMVDEFAKRKENK